jgi:hypothetical protein
MCCNRIDPTATAIAQLSLDDRQPCSSQRGGGAAPCMLSHMEHENAPALLANVQKPHSHSVEGNNVVVDVESTVGSTAQRATPDVSTFPALVVVDAAPAAASHPSVSAMSSLGGFPLDDVAVDDVDGLPAPDRAALCGSCKPIGAVTAGFLFVILANMASSGRLRSWSLRAAPRDDDRDDGNDDDNVDGGENCDVAAAGVVGSF